MAVAVHGTTDLLLDEGEVCVGEAVTLKLFLEVVISHELIKHGQGGVLMLPSTNQTQT